MPTRNKIKKKLDIATAEEGGIRIVTHGRELHMFRVTEDELDNLETAGNYKALDVALFALCVGIFASFLITLFTDPPPVGSLAADAFVTVTVVTGLGSGFFGIRARIAWKRVKKVGQQLRR